MTLKVNKTLRGGLRLCALGRPGLQPMDMPLPVRGKLPRERLEALCDLPIIELSFEFPDSSRKSAVLRFTPPDESSRFSPEVIMQYGFHGVCLYVVDDEERCAFSSMHTRPACVSDPIG